MKKAIAIIMIAIVLITIGVLGFTIYNKMLESEEVRGRIAELSTMELNDLYLSDTSKITETNQPTIITYFHTECSFCQSEIKDIQAHAILAQSAKIVLVSDESEPVIKNFVRDFDVDTSKFRIILDKESILKDHFGVSSVPATFVYGVDSVLIESFKGETKANTLYELIK